MHVTRLSRLIFSIVLSTASYQPIYGADFGVEGGAGVSNGKQILDLVYAENQPTLEVILSYAMFTRSINGIEDINPFGHIALGLQTPDGYRIITVNQKGLSGRDKLFFRITPEDYFYRVSPLAGAIHGSHIGLAYARSSASIQMKVDAAIVEDILKEISAIDSAHQSGETKFCVKTNNCAHLTTQILQKVGMVKPGAPERFPVAVFNQALEYAKFNAKSETEPSIVFIQKVLSDHHYQYENIPMPGYSVLTSLFNLMGFNTLNHLSGPATVISASNQREQLKLEKVANGNALSDTCTRLWIAPFMLAMRRKP